MALAAQKKRLKTFPMQVTRIEEWCVDAETADEATALLAAGQGHRCRLGDCLNVELDSLTE